jgi:hypothetical protein
MQMDRSADALGGASCLRTTRARPAPLADAAGRRLMKVVALGAPVSVQIRVEPCEAPVIVDELRELIIVYETREAEARAGIISEPPDDEGCRDQFHELRQMLDEIVRDGEPPTEPIEVIWPAALAIDVLRGALYEAVERLRTAADDLKATVAIRDALRTVAACLDTWEAFGAIDNGGLQDVAL